MLLAVVLIYGLFRAVCLPFVYSDIQQAAARKLIGVSKSGILLRAGTVVAVNTIFFLYIYFYNTAASN